ncbi:TPA: hypothetical protein ACHD50_001093 [Campylobacter lari]
MSYANKIQNIIQELNKGLLERDEVIKLVLLAFFQVNLYFYMDLLEQLKV